jgi:hypothetical protein
MPMRLLLRTTNTVLIDYATAILRDRGLAPVVLDQHMSILEGSVGVLPRRVMIEEADERAARRALEEAGLAHELAPERAPEREGENQ